MPDIDVDFCIDGREDVYKYVVDKYGGGDYVAQIITFGTMKAKAVVRDVGRVMDLSYAEVDKIAKMIPFDLKMTLERALEESPPLKEAYEKDPITGIVKHLDDACIGCQYCKAACPYEVRFLHPQKKIISKCYLCHHRLDADDGRWIRQRARIDDPGQELRCTPHSGRQEHRCLAFPGQSGAPAFSLR